MNEAPQRINYGTFLRDLYHKRYPVLKSHRLLRVEIAKGEPAPVQPEIPNPVRRGTKRKLAQETEEATSSKKPRQDSIEALNQDEDVEEHNEIPSVEHSEVKARSPEEEDVEEIPNIVRAESISQKPEGSPATSTSSEDEEVVGSYEQKEYVDDVNDRIRIGLVRIIFERLAKEEMAKIERDNVNIKDLLFFRSISSTCCKIAESFELPIKKLKLVIHRESVEIKIWNHQNSLTILEYQDSEENDGTKYATLAAFDFFFLLRSPGIQLARLGFKIAPFEDKDELCYTDVSLLRIIVGLLKRRLDEQSIHLSKLAYMYSREDVFGLDRKPRTDYLDEIVKFMKPRILECFKLRTWDDTRVVNSEKYKDQLALAIAEGENEQLIGGVYLTEQWKKATRLDIRDKLIIKHWNYFADFKEIRMLSLSPEDVNEAQSDLMDDRKQAYTIFVTNSLKLEGIKTELEDIGEFDKDPNSPNFEFPLEFTREEKDGRVFVTNISSNRIQVTVREIDQNANDASVDNN
ncbi:hypothetical protein B9Z55_012488 [Caenorhabditis nigoni]|nr:hypothetical protein B9Z55_012488 [Caenorhabditis nigoni]